jgi:hypothetical protein
MGFPSPFGGSTDDDLFDEADEFVPAHLPTPGQFLQGQTVLTGEDHLAFHETTRDIFDERGVYDMTFGYNLARLNQDTRHPDAGYRYAEEADDAAVLRAEFTPTTAFCPQSDTLTKGAFRAWNELSDRHDYDRVRVRVAETHHQSEDINAALESLEATDRETGSVTPTTDQASDLGTGPAYTDDTETTGRGDAPDAPF